MKVRAGLTGAEATVWVSESSVVCKVGVGGPGSVSVAVTGGERAGSTSGAVSYDGGVVSSVLLSNGAGSGGESVSVSGAGLGTVR